ncbi:unnamed protein product [Ophioblennius macclurei]
MDLLLFSLLFLFAWNGVCATTAQGMQATLQPWLNGLTGVTGFLLLAFGALIIHHLLKNRRHVDEGRSRSKEEEDNDNIKQTSL